MTCVYVYKGEGAEDQSLSMLLQMLNSTLDPEKHAVSYITPKEIIQGTRVNFTDFI